MSVPGRGLGKDIDVLGSIAAHGLGREVIAAENEANLSVTLATPTLVSTGVSPQPYEPITGGATWRRPAVTVALPMVAHLQVTLEAPTLRSRGKVKWPAIKAETRGTLTIEGLLADALVEESDEEEAALTLMTAMLE